MNIQNVESKLPRREFGSDLFLDAVSYQNVSNRIKTYLIYGILSNRIKLYLILLKHVSDHMV